MLTTGTHPPELWQMTRTWTTRQKTDISNGCFFFPFRALCCAFLNLRTAPRPNSSIRTILLVDALYFSNPSWKKNILGRGNWPTRKLHLNAPGSLQRATCAAAQVEGGHAHSKIRVRGAWSTFSSIASADRGPIIITSSLRSSFSEQRIFFVNSKTFISNKKIVDLLGM